MRIIQIIDSLEAGGAEKMAVNYANILANEIEFSGLVVTRKEGSLLNILNSNVNYLFLNKKNKLDFKAVFKLKKYCKANKIDIIQAHSSSFFIATLVKIIMLKIKIIWHDHNGGVVPKREGQFYIMACSVFFNAIISVNQELKTWAQKKLKCKNVTYLSNFSVTSFAEKKETVLEGIAGKRILCLANLRIQKNHLMLIDVAERLKKSHSDWTFHFVGKDFEDNYSEILINKIVEKKLNDKIFLYNSREDVENIISQADICVFSSISEGLPVSLLEFGLQKKPVLSTRVGEIQYIIKDGINGFLVDVNAVEFFYKRLIIMIENEITRNNFGKELFKTISENHGQHVVLTKYLNWIKTIN